MKKLFTLLTMLVLGIGSMWGDKLPKFLTASQIKENATGIRIGLLNVTTTGGKYINGEAGTTNPSSTGKLQDIIGPTGNQVLVLENAGDGKYYLKRESDEMYLACGAGANFTLQTNKNNATAFKVCGRDESEYGSVTGWDNLYSDITPELNDYMIRFIANNQYINGQQTTAVGGLRGVTGAWSFNYVVNADYFAKIKYEISDGSSVIYTSEQMGGTVGETISTLPSELQRPYCTYTVTPTTIVSGENIVPVTVTYNLPFTVSSDFENATWYYWKQSHQNATNNYISYSEGAACPASTSKPESDAGLWAFIGNPYDGFKIINKGAGEGKYLEATSDYPSMTTTTPATTWIIANRSGYAVEYFNVHTGNTNYLNFQNNTFTLRYWNNASAANDNNSTYRVEEYSEDFTSSVETYISPYFENHGKYFAITDDAYTENSAMWEAAKSECNRSTYVSLTNIVNNNIIYPNDGWYLLKNYSTNTYLNTTSSSSVVSSTNNAPSSIVYLDKQDDGTYYIMSQGAYFQTPSVGSNVSRGATPVKFTTEIATAMIVDFKAGSYGLAASDGKIRGGYLRGTGTDAASYWTIEDVSSVNISLTAANDNTGSAHTYATLCVPFNVTALTGADDKEVKAYAPTKDGDYIVSGTGATTITKGTPVLLIGEEGATSVTAILGSSYATTPATSNVLTGTFTGTSIDCTASTGTNYVLGFDRDNDNRIGFYHVNNASYNLKANRAYLNLTGGDARGFNIMFDVDDATGIVTPIGETEEGTVIYNLSGQRLNKIQKGINIVNGKKVLF